MGVRPDRKSAHLLKIKEHILFLCDHTSEELLAVVEHEVQERVAALKDAHDCVAKG